MEMSPLALADAIHHSQAGVPSLTPFSIKWSKFWPLKGGKNG